MQRPSAGPWEADIPTAESSYTAPSPPRHGGWPGAAPLRDSCPSSTCPRQTHTKYFSQCAKTLGKGSFFFLTCDLWSSSVASGPLFCFKAYPPGQTGSVGLASKEMFFDVALPGTLLQKAGVWCGQGNASHPLRKALSGHPGGQQPWWPVTPVGHSTVCPRSGRGNPTG